MAQNFSPKHPKHLIPHRNKWQVKIQIPVDVRWAFGGKTNYKKSTGCNLDQVEQAKAKRDIIVANFKAQVRAHRTGDKTPIISLADEFRKRYQELEMAYKGKDGEKTASEKLEIERSQNALMDDARVKILTQLLGENWEDILDEKGREIESKEIDAPNGSAINSEILWDELDPQGIHKRFIHEVKGKAFITHVEDWKKARMQDKPSRSVKDVNTDVNYVKEFSRDFVLIDDVNWQDVIAYTRKLRDPPQNLAVGSVKRRMTACKQYWEYLDRERGLIKANIKPPFEKLGLPDKRNGKKFDVRAWTPEELETICREPSSHMNRMLKHIIYIGLMTGLRIEEICALEIEDIKYEMNIRIIHVTESKSIAGIRHVPIHSQLEWIFDELIKDSKDGFLISSTVDKYGKRSGKWSKRFGRHKTKLGFPTQVTRFHGIRKFCNTQLSKHGVNKHHRQLLLGWHTDDGEDMADGVYSDAQQAYPMSERKKDIEKVTLELPFIQYGSARYTK